MAHSRIEPFLIDLRPQSVVKVFNVLEELIDFNSEHLKATSKLNEIISGKDYDTHEKYILLYYLKQYLNKGNSRSQFSIKLKEIEDLEDLKELIEKREHLEKYADEILKICNRHLPEYKRKATSNLKSNIKTNFSEIGFNSSVTKFEKLPIELVKGENLKFKQFIIDTFKDIFSDQIINQIIENFFVLKRIDYNVQYLYIEYSRSDEINDAFFKLFKFYRIELKYMREAAKENLRQIAIKIERLRQSDDNKNSEFKRLLKRKEKMYMAFRTSYKDYRNATKKINFAMIMFCAFPKIRENYAKLNATKKLTVEDYLKIVSRNIREKT